ncbi:hypothetical protein HNQ93_002876 [Hymenobacter luteus]|uniref:Uncharacterized protein n=2 Tax=Hymenobacter TaxID=89966 RepID=A0A7W9T1S6_9BACT|nr:MULTISPECIES: hypothetical protein [Hymenobacter]MBB4601556.1 hypothetical protein [Hymenobacter latericoloratus]MBB6060016.1 hypothetical protein [Hymenobacter luteus]
MILESESSKKDDFESNSFVTAKQLLGILEKRNEFKEDLQKIFEIDENKNEVFKIGNASYLLSSLNRLDKQCEKIDITSKIKNIYLSKILEEEKALFEVFSTNDNFIRSKTKSDLLIAETRYSAKNDILDYFNFSKFANYCRDKEFDSLINTIKEYLRDKNSNNEEEKNLRLIYKNSDEKFYIRAFTSGNGYKDFGINFSVFFALVALGRYVETSKNEIFIDNYRVDDSTLYVSFSMKNQVRVSNNLHLSFNLILENDEIKRSSVSFNGVFKLKFEDNSKTSQIYIRPKGIKTDEYNHPVDLLTFPHRGKVETIFDKTKQLPQLIDFFIKQVSDDAKKIANIQNPDDVRKFISEKVKNSKNQEFKTYKDAVYKKLTTINVDNTFKLFELLREVEELFEHDDVISRNFWRTKLYESLIERT